MNLRSTNAPPSRSQERNEAKEAAAIWTEFLNVRSKFSQ